MKVLVTGAGGMLAQALIPALATAGHEAVGLARAELDVTNRAAVDRALAAAQPDAVVQCAAFTAVDAAEEEYEQAVEVNATATLHLARACHTLGASFVYPSTDYVFDGTGTRPYRPTDAPRPVNAYGRSKLAGEEAAAASQRHLVVRTSWLHGIGGPNFVATMLRLADERDRIEVVDDQVGRPTWSRTLADAIVRLLEVEAQGIVHVTDGGEPTSWYGFAREILAVRGAAGKVHPTTSASFVRPARRPDYSVLDLSEAERLLGHSFPDWRKSLQEHLGELAAS
ncbi:MAG: dTDP-4-dehydrorhamnose reductase [Gemmatimonadetes bacterium]|nr:dTDP-4-dehydrorhamnose reductase [Gemmatimonadota bacterium]